MTTATVSLTDFFNAVLPLAAPEEYFELRAKDGQEQIVARAFFAPDGASDDELRFIVEHDQLRHDVYFGCTSRVEKDGVLKGDAAHCHTAYALWSDHDFKATPEEQARDLLAGIPDPPSIIVHSGGGLHSYWLLARPTPADATLKRWLVNLAYTLQADPAAALITQILRVPGTRNWKKPALYPEGRPVVIETFEPDRKLVLP
jgi:hypothetical protein